MKNFRSFEASGWLRSSNLKYHRTYPYGERPDYRKSRHSDRLQIASNLAKEDWTSPRWFREASRQLLRFLALFRADKRLLVLRDPLQPARCSVRRIAAGPGF